MRILQRGFVSLKEGEVNMRLLVGGSLVFGGGELLEVLYRGLNMMV